MQIKSLLRILLIALLLVVLEATRTLAGTTGGISGKVADSNGNPVADAQVSASSPSQTATRTTSSSGFYVILNLSPDTYTISVTKAGYDTAVVKGVTVQADQTAGTNITLNRTTKVLGRIVTTAQTSVVSKSITGDLYAVNAEAISNYQGSVGGSESLYSQTGTVGSLPGVVKLIGIGGGYQQGQGSLSMRGGAFDQIGFELEGIQLNRGFDFYNATPFITNGLSNLEVYTGGQPASEGRAMSGYVNEVIRRGSYPFGGDLTLVTGTPSLSNIINFDVYGGTPNNKFTYFISTLGLYAKYNYGDSHDLDNTLLSIPAGDPGCLLVAGINYISFGAPVPPQLTCTPTGNLASAQSFNAPISTGAWFPNGSPINPSAHVWDTVANLHWTISHNGLQDDLQALYNVGYTTNPYKYSGTSIDPALSCFNIGAIDYPSTPGFSCTAGPLLWPTGDLYHGALGAPFDPSRLEILTWPESGNDSVVGSGYTAVPKAVPGSYIDNQWTQHSIEKLSYTRSLTASSFVRIYGYALYSAWLIDQATNGFLGGTYYQLHDNATGVTLNYQNQLNAQHLLRFDADYMRDKTLRYNYGNWLLFNQNKHGELGNYGSGTLCLTASAPFFEAPCAVGDTVISKGAPYGYWNDIPPTSWDFSISDQWKPNDKLLFDLGARFDEFRFPLMPLQITGPGGLAVQAENQFGQCLLGFNYSPSDPAVIGYIDLVTGNAVYPSNCFHELTALFGPAGEDPTPAFAPGGAPWQDVSGALAFRRVSPRFGLTFTPNPQNVFRFSVGRFVQPPDSAFEEYRGAPFWGSYATVAILNRGWRGHRFLAVHNVQPEDSSNWDLSWEHDFGGGLSAKLTPYYRTTHGQILSTPISSTSPSFVTGFNYGTARIYGLEFLTRLNRTQENGWSGTFAATYTNSKIRFGPGPAGTSVIDDINAAIKAYNTDHGTNFPLEDTGGYYSPSFTVGSQGVITPSWDVPWVVNINADYRINGWDILPTFNYMSGYPYGDPIQFPDASCFVTASTICDTFGPDPYTHQFDALGSLKGPSFWTINLGVSHDLTKNTKITALVTNLFTQVHNHGYKWEYPEDKQVIAYGDNTFYAADEAGGQTAFAANPTAYLGDAYWPYAPNNIMPTQQLTISISTKF